ncbi:MAG: L-seryl-tRNA(Sec) selenium transferase [Chloroflexota bacterium]|nr:L-seryl-tRNA(Sec) selenium transferase [Chloroflexota bacterium]
MVVSVDLRRIPSVDALLRHPDIAALSGPLPRQVVAGMVREELAEQRQRLRSRNGAVDGSGIGEEGRITGAGDVGALVAGILRRAEAFGAPSLRRVINATGVVLHTNLGRAPLSASTARAMMEIASGYANLEYDLAAGARGSRHTHLERAICDVTGAEAALAVNNTAAAVLLVLAEVAAGREVIVSRGQAIEIGGGFRIPDVLRQSGARLVEVGTTNRTRLADYAAAIGPQTGALLYVHTSNFRVVGFSESVFPDALANLGRERGVPTIGDQGSGCLLPTERYGIAGELREPTVQEYVGAGMDAVCFSGDKLLGGPQAGIIAGRADLIARLKGHPLTRALRLDKIAIAGLSATLRHYQAREAEQEVPVWRMIALTADALRATAERWAATLQQNGREAHVLPAASAIGGGSLPGVTLPTHVVALRPCGSVAAAAATLRQGAPPIVGRIAGDQLLIDPRTVLPEDEVALLSALAAL